jgi:hypothetical protein
MNLKLILGIRQGSTTHFEVHTVNTPSSTPLDDNWDTAKRGRKGGVAGGVLKTVHRGQAVDLSSLRGYQKLHFVNAVTSQISIGVFVKILCHAVSSASRYCFLGKTNKV